MREVLQAEYPQHKLLFFYALGLLLVSNCSNYRTNKLSNLLNLLYTSEMKKLSLADFNNTLSGYILTVVHSAAARAGRQFFPEIFRFVLQLLQVVSRKPALSYRSLDFDDSIQKIFIEDVQEEWVLLHATLKVLKGLVDSNSRYCRSEIVRVNIFAELESLRDKFTT